MELSIIIVNWNTCRLLVDCLNSVISNLLTVKYEIWVVDNNSSDESVQVLRREFPQVNLIENHQNQGFGAANNLAIYKARGKLILFLNSDTLVQPDAIEKMILFLDQNPKIGIIGPKLKNPDGSLQESVYTFPTLISEFRRLFHLENLFSSGIGRNITETSKPMQVDGIKGACMLFRRKVLDQIGKFDPDFFMYSEEVDLCYKARRSGWEIVWDPEAEIIHFGGQSTKQAARNSFLNLYQSKILFFRKHYGVLSANCYKFILLLASFTRILVLPFSYFEGTERRKEHFILARRYFDLITSISTM